MTTRDDEESRTSTNNPLNRPATPGPSSPETLPSSSPPNTRPSSSPSPEKDSERDLQSPHLVGENDIPVLMDVDNGEEHEHILGDEGELLSEDYMQDLRRVKVYELVGQNWRDLGTAFCSGEYDETAREAQLVAKSEETQDILLQITVRVDDVYQRQADTLIVWTEPNGKDYALSFQDVEGCSEVWDFIMEVRRHLKSQDDLGSSSPFNDQGALTGFSGRLPPPSFASLGDIERTVRAMHRSGPLKERVVDFIVSTEYIPKLTLLMKQAEDLESIQDLHSLCTLMQSILMLNDGGIYDHILRDDIFEDVIGLLEYDPEFPNYKAEYRSFIRGGTQYHRVIDIKDPPFEQKIHHTYKLQYLKDVVLARVLDDPTFGILSSIIAYNHMDIVQYIQNEDYFLRDIFGLFPPGGGSNPTAKALNGKEVDADTCKKALLLVHQFASMGKVIQLPMRLPLFRTLVDKGVLNAIQWAFTRSENDTKLLNTAGEILAMVLEYDSGGIRGMILKQAEIGEKPSLLQVMTMLLVRHTIRTEEDNTRLHPDELSLKSQLAESFRVLMDVPGVDAANVRAGALGHQLERLLKSPPLAQHQPQQPPLQSQHQQPPYQGQPGSPVSPTGSPPNNLIGGTGSGGGPMHNMNPNNVMPQIPGLKLPLPRKEDAQSEKFLEYFYRHCAAELYRPLIDAVPEHKAVTKFPLELTKAQSDLYLYLCDLLSGFLIQHSYQSHYFILASNTTLASRISSLLSAREKHLRLAAFRFFRTFLKLNNRNLLAHLMKHEVFLPILEFTKREAKRDNLMSSCCQEFFEHVRRENFKDVIDHIMKSYEPLIRELSESPVVGARFSGIIRRWEINCEPPPKPEPKPVQPAPKRWGIRAVDVEEAYFNGEEEDGGASGSAGPVRNLRVNARRRGASISSPMGGTVPRRSQRPANVALPRAFPIGGPLVDYEDEALEPSASPSPPLDVANPDGPRLRSRNKRPSELTRTMSSWSLVDHSSWTGEGPSESAGASSSEQMPRKSSSEIAPVAMEEEDDLIGPPVPLSHKRRREDDEDEGLERLVKRPALSGTPTSPDKESNGPGAADGTTSAVPPVATSPNNNGKLKLKMKLGGAAQTGNVPAATPDSTVGEKG